MEVNPQTRAWTQLSEASPEHLHPCVPMEAPSRGHMPPMAAEALRSSSRQCLCSELSEEQGIILNLFQDIDLFGSLVKSTSFFDNVLTEKN